MGDKDEKTMLRMEIALILVMVFVGVIYFSAGWRHTLLHTTFSVLLIAMLVHLSVDAVTVNTVNHLDAVPQKCIWQWQNWEYSFCRYIMQ